MLQLQKIRAVYSRAGNLFFSLTRQSWPWVNKFGSGVTMPMNVTVLRPKDQLRQNIEPVAAMYRDLGTAQAEQVVTRALGELALAMSGLAAQVRAHEMQDLARQLRRLQRLSEQLGMLSLSQVAGDLRICLDRGDSTAFSAVWARLLRVAERSLVVDKGLIESS